MQILALDTSLNTGYALGGGNPDDTVFGTVYFHKWKDDYAACGRMFSHWLGDFLDEKKPAILILEKPLLFNNARGGVTQLLNGLVWEAHREAEFRDIPRIEYAPTSIKKFIAGNGRAEKSAVIEAVQAKGFAVEDDHQADAVAMLLLHLSETQTKGDDNG